jgi:hypothetical protein
MLALFSILVYCLGLLITKSKKYMFEKISRILTGGVVKSIENIALEWIETDTESAEAKVLKIKALDPNGKMRRDISKNVGGMYRFYLISTAVMIFVELIYCMIMGDKLTDTDFVLVAISTATDKMTTLFIPITALYGAIVTASFGVNYANVKQSK